jgi:ACS family hexuronate transporter-like MFS transporter
MPSPIRQVRWWILALLFLVTVINFVDRQSLSIVAPVLRDSLHLSNTDYGRIVASFQAGMMLAEFPMGLLMDKRGVRFGFSFAVLWWSLANGLHVFARTMMQFSVLRFWLGTGECGNFSGAMKVISQWYPAKERALAVGVFNGGSMVGSIIAPPLLVFFTLRMGWPAAFLLPSLLGFLWVAVWIPLYRAPEEHPLISREELEYIQGGREAGEDVTIRNIDLLRLRQTWGLILCRFLVGPVVQFYIYWMPEYLYRERGLTLKSIGLLAWVPYLFGDIGSISGGWLAGYLIGRGFSAGRARRWTMTLGSLFCILSLAVAGAHSVSVALLFICAVLFGHTAISANMFAAISDIFPAGAVGRVTALTGVAGGLSGMLFPLLTGALVDRISYWPVFLMAGLMPGIGCALLFLLAGKLTPIGTQTPKTLRI